MGIAKEILDIEGAIISDRNAASSYANYYMPEIGLNKINYELIYERYWVDQTDDPRTAFKKKSIKCAEVLIPDFIPYEYVRFAVVVSPEVSQKLIMTGFNKKIVIRPAMFF